MDTTKKEVGGNERTGLISAHYAKDFEEISKKVSDRLARPEKDDMFAYCSYIKDFM